MRYMNDLEAGELIHELSEKFPHADQVVIGVLVDALATHNAKHHDYNGKHEFFSALGIKGRFSDVWKKVIRLFVLVWDEESPLVDESLDQNSTDLVVYSAMLTAEIRKGKR